MQSRGKVALHCWNSGFWIVAKIIKHPCIRVARVQNSREIERVEVRGWKVDLREARRWVEGRGRQQEDDRWREKGRAQEAGGKGSGI